MRTETKLVTNIKVTLFDEVAYDREKKNLVIVERLNRHPRG